MEESEETEESVAAACDKELIDWDEDQLKAQGRLVKAKHGKITAAVRGAIPPQKICSLFCGGKKCKFDNPTNWKDNQMEVDGLYSNWITENILAMARPNTVHMEKYKIIDQFKSLGISSIINLQLPGEHAGCGHGLDESGFSYSPQQFMENKVFFYNFGWEDFGVGSLHGILDTVKVMQFALSEGKVAVHCHAGLGRTGVLIACYLVFANKLSASEAVNYVRSKRKGAIQTLKQVGFVQEFSSFLAPIRMVFSTLEGHNGNTSFVQFLARQKHLLHGYESRALKNIPKLLFVCCERLLQLAKKGRGYQPSADHEAFKEIMPTEANNSQLLSARSDKTEDSPVASSALNGADNMGSETLRSTKQNISLGNFTAVDKKTFKSKLSQSSFGSALELPVSEIEHETASVKEFYESHCGNHVEVIADAMGETVYSNETKEAILECKKRLNEDNSYYNVLAHEKNPHVLAAVMWDWLDHLKEPLLTPQDLAEFTEYTSEPLAALSSLDKGPRTTVEYLVKVIARLEPISETKEQRLLQRMLSTLTHQNIVIEYHALAAPENENIRRTNNDIGFMRENVARKLLIFFSHLIHVICQKLVNSEKLETSHNQRSCQGRSDLNGSCSDNHNRNEHTDIVVSKSGKPKKRGR